MFVNMVTCFFLKPDPHSSYYCLDLCVILYVCLLMAGQRQTTHGKTPSPKQNDIQELSPLSHRTLQALLADHFEADEEEAQSKWREGTRTMMGECSTGRSVSDILTSWENPVFKKPEQVQFEQEL